LVNSLRSQYVQSQIKLLLTGSTRSSLGIELLRELNIPSPPPPRTKKIAKILTSVDEVIETTETQINKLKDLKKGMMNELLTKGIGHTEFKDSTVGRIPVGWEVTTLGKVGRWSGGGTPSKSNALFWMGNIPWVSPKDMKCENIFRTEDYISEEAISNSSTNLISKNSILIVARSGILKHTLPVAIADCDLTINQDMKSIEIKSDYCCLYIYHFLMANNHKILRACLKAGNTVESLDFNELKKYKIPKPKLNEQKKIAEVVESVAIRIRTKEKLLFSLKNLKKSLMADLLTGRVRV
jgi:type I restriction enzyme, S subunit